MTCCERKKEFFHNGLCLMAGDKNLTKWTMTSISCMWLRGKKSMRETSKRSAACGEGALTAVAVTLILKSANGHLRLRPKGKKEIKPNQS